MYKKISTLFLCLCILALFQKTGISQSVSLISSKLPIFIIDTHGASIPDEPKITADMKVIYHGDGILNTITDTAFHYKGKIGIEQRGSSSASYPKKQWSVETRDIAGNDSDCTLLGFPAESDWILYAPYSDKSCVRDVMVYNLASKLGQYATRSKYVEVILNGEYQGLYILLEKIKRDKNRVNISKCETPDTTGDALTGGYIYKIDKIEGADVQGWYSPYLPFSGSSAKIYYQYHYPKQEDIMPQQKVYLQNMVQTFESIMNSASYADTLKGYASVINVNSFIDNMLINELSKNVDGYRLSTYFYRDKLSKGGKIFAGPVWDYNISFGNADYYDGWKPEGLHISFMTTNSGFMSVDGYQPPFFWKRFLNDQNFTSKLRERYISLRKTYFSTTYLYSQIDSLSASFTEARIRNFQKWPIFGIYVWPNYYIAANYDDEISYLKVWIYKRIAWLDSYFNFTGVESEQPLKAGSFLVSQNYPNPFNPSTTIRFRLAATEQVDIRVYDVLGNEVANLLHNQLNAGEHEVAFDAAQLPSGTYFAHCTAGKNSQTVKMLLLK